MFTGEMFTAELKRLREEAAELKRLREEQERVEAPGRRAAAAEAEQERVGLLGRAKAAEAAEAAERAAANWSKGKTDSWSVHAEHMDAQVALGMVATLAKNSVKAFLGDFAAVLGLADDLQGAVATFSCGSSDKCDRKALADYDEKSGRYATCVVEKDETTQTYGCLFCTWSKTSISIKITVTIACASNEAARTVCQGMINKKVTGGLLKFLDNQQLFPP